VVPESVVEYLVWYHLLIYIIALWEVKSVEPAEEQRGAGERGGVPGVVPPANLYNCFMGSKICRTCGRAAWCRRAWWSTWCGTTCYSVYLLSVIVKSVEPTEEQCGAGERG
jgi:hypothetical protein